MTDRSGRSSKVTAGAKKAIRRWEKDGERDEQDYYHVPGSAKVDHEEAEIKRARPKRKAM